MTDTTTPVALPEYQRDPMTIEAMRKYGGGFIQALSAAASRADNDNLALIKQTWPEYWDKYEAIAQKEAAR